MSTPFVPYGWPPVVTDEIDHGVGVTRAYPDPSNLQAAERALADWVAGRVERLFENGAESAVLAVAPFTGKITKVDVTIASGIEGQAEVTVTNHTRSRTPVSTTVKAVPPFVTTNLPLAAAPQQEVVEGDVLTFSGPGETLVRVTFART